jgi:dephospho-CoA kinase
VFRLGITGGIGMGKSAAAEILTSLGVSVVDTDRIAREVVAPGQPALGEVLDSFGEDLRLADGSLDRARLGRVVFADAEARRRLEGILHPRIREVWMAQLEAWETAGVAVGAVVIPLLFETQAASFFREVACLACSDGSQRIRLRQRGWSEEEIDRRREAQWPVAAKIERSDAVIWTEPPVEVQVEQWRRWMADRGLA